MAFSNRGVKPSKGSPAFVSARTANLSRSMTGTTNGPPKTKLTAALQNSMKGQPGSPGAGQTWSHATPGHGSPAPGTDHESPGTARGNQWQPRDRSPNWHYNRSADKRKTVVHEVHDNISPGIKRLQSNVSRQPTLQMQASRQETFQLGSPAKQISSRPAFQDSQRSPGIESVSTNTGGVGGGNPWSPSPAGSRSAYRLKRYSVGGATQMFKEEDLKEETGPTSAMYGDRVGGGTNPQAWTNSEKLSKWELRLHGDAKIAEKDDQLRQHREQQQAHDASLTEAFSRNVRPAPGSPRATSCEATTGTGIAGHPSQKGMRTAFTDRALKQAHMSEHFSLGHPEDAAQNQWDSAAERGAGSPASFDMPAAGNGGLTKGPKGALATMHMDGTGSPGGNSARAKTSTESKVGYLITHATVSKDPARDETQVKRDEGFFRKQMGNRGTGDMAPTARDITRARARSADNLHAGAFHRPWGVNLDIFTEKPPAKGGEKHTERRQVQDWLPSDRVKVADCLVSARDDAAGAATELVYMQGHSPPSTKFSTAFCQKQGGSKDKEGWKGFTGGRPAFVFDNTKAYGSGRRMGRGENHEFSAQSTKHAIGRDAESAIMYRYELIATGEATPRAFSQPPVYNPVTHEGELYPSLANTQCRGKAMTPRSARLSSTRSAGRLLDFQAGKEEDQELRSNRMKHDQAFSDICQHTARENEKRSQEVAQNFRQNHAQKSSNMALLLSWE